MTPAQLQRFQASIISEMPSQRVHAHITNIVPLQIQHAGVHVAPGRVAIPPSRESVQYGRDARRPKGAVPQIQAIEGVPRPFQVPT